MPKKKDYSHLPPALRPKSKKVKEKQRAQAQRVRSKAAQTKARKTSKAKDKWGNVKQAVQDVRSSDAVALGAVVLSRGRGKGGGVKLPKFKRLELPKAPRIAKAKKEAGQAAHVAKYQLKKATTTRTKAKARKAAVEKKSKAKAAIKPGDFDMRAAPTFKEQATRGAMSTQRRLQTDPAYRRSTRIGKGRKTYGDGTPWPAPRGKILESGKAVVKAKKAVKRAQTTASTPVKPRAKAKKAPAKKSPSRREAILKEVKPGAKLMAKVGIPWIGGVEAIKAVKRARAKKKTRKTRPKAKQGKR